MDSSGGMFKIEKLSESNFHVWKHKVELIFAFRELDSHIDDSTRRPTDSAELEKWTKDDAKARAIIGLTLSDDHLEHVRECQTANDMWSTIIDLFQRKTLLNKLAARRRFYSAKMNDSEKAMAFISRIRQLASDCKAMDVDISDQDMAMTVLCGLPQKFEHLIVAIDAAADDDTLTMDFVKSRLLQEEQRMTDRSDSKPSPSSALVMQQGETSSQNMNVCTHCGKPNHHESRCWKKYPHLRPKRGPSKQSGLVVAGNKPMTDKDDHDSYVCLVSQVSSDCVRLACEADWIIDSGATAHICNDRNMFTSFETVESFDIRIGDQSGVRVSGKGKIDIMLLVSGKPVKCMLSDVLYAPTMGFNMLSVRRMSRAGQRTVFQEHDCYVEKDNKVLAEGVVRNGLYYLSTCVTNDGNIPSMGLIADLNLWHQRLAHVHVDGIRDMVRNGVVEGIKVDLKKSICRCDACVYGKSTRAPIPQIGGARAEDILELVHTDVCGPFPVPSIGGSNYFVSFVDDHSRFTWIYPIQSKSDVFRNIQEMACHG